MDRRLFITSLFALSQACGMKSPGHGSARLLVENYQALLPGLTLGDLQVRGLLDTAANVSAVSDELADRLGLVGDEFRFIATPKGPVRSLVTGTVEVKIPGLDHLPTTWAIMPRAMMPDVDCVIGATYLDTFNLSFSQQRLLEYAVGGSGKSLNIWPSPIPVATLSGPGVQLEMIVDSGARFSSVGMEIANVLSVMPGVSSLRYLTNNGIETRAVRIPRLSCGEATFENVLLRARMMGNRPEIAGKEIGGALGMDFMQHHDWFFGSQPPRVEQLSFLGGFQQWIGSGLQVSLNRESEGQVIGLAEGGPASRAGIRLGDRILSMEGLTPAPQNRAALNNIENRPSLEITFFDAASRAERTIIVQTEPLI